jgi:cytosine/adenosine deaminase-related metal-dependent hydrolase
MTILIRGGSVLDPSTGSAQPHDVLIDGGTIHAVGESLAAPPDAEVLDATDRLVLPGFVDAHRHTWQAAIRGVAPDVTLPAYIELCLRKLGPAFTPDDLRLAQLAGALECLDAGITTVFDYSHLQLSPAHTDAAIDGLRAAGIRAVFGYSRIGQHDSTLQAAELRRVHTQVGGLVTAAVGAAGPELSPPEQVRAEWAIARELGIGVSIHVGGRGPAVANEGLRQLRDAGLLGSDVLLAHANGYGAEALAAVAGSGAAIAVSPTIEPVMGHGLPVTGAAHAAGVTVGLGADVVTSGPGDLFAVMRAGYLLDRARTGPSPAALTAADLLRMATTGGAAAVGLGDSVGALRPRMAADVVLLRTDLLATAPVHDPVAAVVLHADTRAVDTVLAGGRVVKRDGRLVGHDPTAVVAELHAAADRIAGAPMRS